MCFIVFLMISRVFSRGSTNDFWHSWHFRRTFNDSWSWKLHRVEHVNDISTFQMSSYQATFSKNTCPTCPSLTKTLWRTLHNLRFVPTSLLQLSRSSTWRWLHDFYTASNNDLCTKYQGVRRYSLLCTRHMIKMTTMLLLRFGDSSKFRTLCIIHSILIHILVEICLH